MRSSSPYVQCIHGKQQNVCERRHQKRKVPRGVDLAADSNERTSVKGTLDKTRDSVKLCIPEDDVKYRLTRVSLERFNLFLVETGCACNIEVRSLWSFKNTKLSCTQDTTFFFS